jgi:hypothetical protein
MADSHPFSNAGLGMFGSAENMYAKSAMQGSDKKDGLLGKAAGALLDASGIKSFLDKTFGGNESVSGIAPPVTVMPNYGVAPPAPISPEGINPMRLPNAVQGGVGLNAAPAGAMNPFQFQTKPVPQLAPDDEHKNQIKSAWS